MDEEMGTFVVAVVGEDETCGNGGGCGRVLSMDSFEDLSSLA